ncbi:MAG: tetratricopeptide repeat protein [Pseudonocardiaceae bacterium]
MRRVARSVGLSEQISSTLVDLAGTALPGVAKATQTVGGLLYGQAKKAVARHRILSEHGAIRCTRFSVMRFAMLTLMDGSGLRDSWSARERADAAARVMVYLQLTATSAAASGDRSTQVTALRQAIALCHLTGQFVDWLVDGVQRLLGSGGWGLLADLPSAGDGVVSALLIGVQGARQRRSGRLDDAVALMSAALGRPNLPRRLHRFLLLHRAHALRVAGRYADAGLDYRELWGTPGAFNSDAGYWLADYAFLQGRFEEALSALDQLPREATELQGEILRLRGHVYRVNGMFDRAEASYREALDLARATANIGAEGKALTDLVQTLAWCRPAAALDIKERALEINESLRNLVEIVKLRAATAVAFTSLGDLDEAHAEIERGLATTGECGYTGGLVWCWVARTFTEIARCGADGGREAAERVSVIVGELDGNRFWSEIAGWWAGVERSDHDGDPRWIEGPAAARARWLAVCSPHARHEA